MKKIKTDPNRQAELQAMEYDSAVRRLLISPRGASFDPEELYERTGVRFQGESFVAASLEDDPTAPPSPPPEDESTPSQRYLILRDLILSVFQETHRAVVCNLNGRILCLVNWQTGAANWHGSFSALVDELNRRLWAVNGFRFQCVVSRMFQGLGGLEQAQKELEEAGSYRQLLGGLPGEVLFYDGLLRTVERESGGNALAEEQERSRLLQQALLQGDSEEAKAVFRQIVEKNFVTSRPAIKFVPLRIFSVIDSFLKSLNQAGDELGFREELQALDAAPRLLEAKGIWELQATAEALLEEYQAVFDRNRRDISLPYQIKAYVQEAYADPNLNVNRVADHFQVTPTYATRTFKQAFGLGILQYIQQVRMQEAKALLSTHTVKTAAELVGFSSSAPLIRLFKKLEGQTPAQFIGQSGRKDSHEEKGEAI